MGLSGAIAERGGSGSDGVLAGGAIEFNRGKVCSDRGMEPVWMISREPKPACRYPTMVLLEPWTASWQPRTLQDAGAVHRAVPLRC